MSILQETLTKREIFAKIGGLAKKIAPITAVLASNTTLETPSVKSDTQNAFSRRTLLKGFAVATALTVIPEAVFTAADRMAGIPNPLPARTVYAAEPMADGGVLDQPATPDAPQPISIITPDNPQGIAGLEKNGRRALQEIAGGIGFDPATQQITINATLDTTNVPPGKYSGLYVNIGNSDEPAELHVQYVSGQGWSTAFRSTPAGQKETTINKIFKNTDPAKDITVTIKNGRITVVLGSGETLSFTNTPVELTKTGIINIGSAVAAGGPLVINNLNYLVEPIKPEPPMETFTFISPDKPVLIGGQKEETKRFNVISVPQETPIKVTADVNIKPLVDLLGLPTSGVWISLGNGLSGENNRWFTIYALSMGGWWFQEAANNKIDYTTITKVFDSPTGLINTGKKLEVILNPDGKTGTITDITVPNSPKKIKFALKNQFFSNPEFRQVYVAIGCKDNIKTTVSSLVIEPSS